MKLSTFSPDDLPKIIPIQPNDWDNITKDFEYYLNRDFCKIIKIEEGNQLCGVGVNILFGKTAWLSHIIVGQNFRKRGIGTIITRELLNISKKNQIETTSLIATDLGKPIYFKAGFKEVENYIYLKRKEGKIDFEISKNVKKLALKDYSKILKLDEHIAGENRELLILDYLKEALIYEEKDEILGYYIPHLCNEPIYAVNDTAGIELMKCKYSKAQEASFPESNKTALKFLFENGFETREKEGTRMIFGKKLDWQPKMFYSRIGGNFG